MYHKKCTAWYSIAIGVAAGILIYTFMPLKWLLLVMCIIVLYIGFVTLFR